MRGSASSEQRAGPAPAPGALHRARLRPGKVTSTQESFGRLLTGLAGHAEVAARLVTTSPDVSVSTNLGGWINKVGVFAPAASPTSWARAACCAGARARPATTSSWASAR